ncbi:mercury transporter [Streptomyces sp. C10-9-1]|uniref:mercury transporter n=1 Tax=Streptomyces sp. C10-9-1 TaxID=1859285 RepID=UPI002110EFAE|nr:mercury transporter [Streptomyces sp. C10-9-1]MCQ6556839.1 mercury transporter [Streptomyces sp. C10-9-1]
MNAPSSAAWPAVAGAGLLVVVCCAGPLLVAGGALGAVGGALASPWLITVGAVVVLAGTGYALHCRARRRRGAGPQDCCPTVPAETQPNEEVDEVDPGGDAR